jgi:hypothetical protein
MENTNQPGGGQEFTEEELAEFAQKQTERKNFLAAGAFFRGGQNTHKEERMAQTLKEREQEVNR